MASRRFFETKNHHRHLFDKMLAEMVNKMGKTILETLKPKGHKVWESFMDVVHSLRPGVIYYGAGSTDWFFQVL